MKIEVDAHRHTLTYHEVHPSLYEHLRKTERCVLSNLKSSSLVLQENLTAVTVYLDFRVLEWSHILVVLTFKGLLP